MMYVICEYILGCMIVMLAAVCIMKEPWYLPCIADS